MCSQNDRIFLSTVQSNSTQLPVISSKHPTSMIFVIYYHDNPVKIILCFRLHGMSRFKNNLITLTG